MTEMRDAGRGLRETADDGVSSVESAPGIDRREALRRMSLMPLLGAIGISGVDLERAARAVEALPQGQAYAPKFFTADEWRTVNVLVDYVIPRDDRSGSATDAKVPEFMDFMMSDPETNASQRSREQLKGGLAWLDAECTRRAGRGFVQSSDAQRRAVLDDIAWPRRARDEMREGVAFFNTIRNMTAAGFFSSESGWRDLDFRGNTFAMQWDGCPGPAMRKLGVSHDLMNTRVPVQHGGD